MNSLSTIIGHRPDRWQRVTMYDAKGRELRVLEEYDINQWMLHYLEPQIEITEYRWGTRERKYTRHAVYHLHAYSVHNELTIDIVYRLDFAHWF